MKTVIAVICCAGWFAIGSPWLLGREPSDTDAAKVESKEIHGDSTNKPDEATCRTIYVARNSSVGSLVYLLEKHFEGNAGVKFVAEPNSNLLSIRASSAASLDEVLKTLAQIDRPLRQVVINVLFVEFKAPEQKAESGVIPRLPIDLSLLAGSLAHVDRQLGLWAREGHVTLVRRFELKAHENQHAQLLLAEMRPVATSVIANGVTGIASPVFTIRDFGLLIDAVPRISATEEISVALSVHETQLDPADRGAVMAKGANGPIVSQGTSIKRLASTVSMANGQASATTAFEPGAGSAHVPAAIIVSARIADGNSKIAVSDSTAPKSVPSGVLPGPAPSTKPEAGENRGAVDPNTATLLQKAPERQRFSRPRMLISAIRDESLSKRLQLTEDQQKQFDQLNRDLSTFSRSGSGFAEISESIMKIEQKALELLTDEQKKVWAEYLEQHRKTPVDPKQVVPGTNPPVRDESRQDAPTPPAPTGRTSSRGPSRFPRGTPAERLAAFNELLMQQPEDADLLRRRAAVHVQLQQWDDAIADLRAAIKSTDGIENFADLFSLLIYQQDDAASRDCARQLLERLNARRMSADAIDLSMFCLLLPDGCDEQKRVLSKFIAPHNNNEMNSPQESSRRRSSFAESIPFTPLGNPGTLNFTNAVVHLLQKQPLLAIHQFESILKNTAPAGGLPLAHRFDDSRTKILLAFALVEIGDSERANSLLDGIAREIDSTPKSLPAVMNHALYRKAITQLRSGR